MTGVSIVARGRTRRTLAKPGPVVGCSAQRRFDNRWPRTVGLSTVAREHISPACPDSAAPTGPVRTCVGCRQRAAKSELLRVTVGSDAHGHPAVVPDPGATSPGRGAHLHPTAECYELAVRRRAFARALRHAGQGGLTSAPLGEYLDSPAHQP
ncbi:YlxR family protein [Nocardioides ginsengisegetis]|uniref:YlxR family protein n=1 Tax=Nocardioides ginsengisegetis TaxID=661491 RepID=UPI0031B632C3